MDETATLRDDFAMTALPALIGKPKPPSAPTDQSEDDWIAQRCYALADAMLRARQIGGE